MGIQANTILSVNVRLSGTTPTLLPTLNGSIVYHGSQRVSLPSILAPTLCNLESVIVRSSTTGLLTFQWRITGPVSPIVPGNTFSGGLTFIFALPGIELLTFDYLLTGPGLVGPSNFSQFVNPFVFTFGFINLAPGLITRTFFVATNATAFSPTRGSLLTTTGQVAIPGPAGF